MEQTLTYYLYPSTIFASKIPHEVSTILGSCVAVCLWDNALQIGGINHFMLPLWNGEGLPTPKFGNIATEKLIERMMQLGSRPANLTAKVFGGAKQLDKHSNFFNVGERNIIQALDMLQEANIPVSSQSTGGDRGRKLKYRTDTGQVLMKLL